MKKFSLAVKIAFGFAIILVFLGGVAFIGFNSLSGVVDRSSKSDAVSALVTSILSVRQYEKNYIMRNDDTFVQKVDDGVKGLIIRVGEIKASFKKKINKDQMDQVTEKTREYSTAFLRFVELRKKKAEEMTLMRAKARIVLQGAEEIRTDQKEQFEVVRKTSEEAMLDKLKKADDANRMIKWFLDCRKNEKEYIISGDKKFLDAVTDQVEKIGSLAGQLKSRFTNQQNIDKLTELQNGLKEYAAAFKVYVEMTNRQKEAEDEMVKTARAAMEVCAAAHADQKAKMESQITTANRIIWIGAAIALICGIFFAIAITRSITKPVGRIIAGLTEGATQVASASGQVSSSSQSMAEGASQQAASIEETSSSMEEIVLP